MPVLNLKGSKLPNNAKLSDYLPSALVFVRLTDLRPEQVIEIDVSLDGIYLQPDDPKEPAWVSPDGKREGVHSALLSIVGGSEFKVNFTQKAELRQSRGRALSLTRISQATISDIWVNGARTAGIAAQECEGVKLIRPVTVDTDNYLEQKQDMNVFNVAGSITLKNCKKMEVIDAISCDHIGNGITATESDGGTWTRPTTLGVYGANLYVNASPNHTIRGGIALGSKTHRPNGYVVNSEEENKGIPSENAVFEDCLAFDVEFPFGVWGNEDQTIPLNRVATLNSRFVGNASGPKLSNRTPITTFDQTGTRYLRTVDIDPTALAAIRNLRNGLADLVRAHADWKEIEAEREALRFAIGTLGGPVVDPDPDPEPLDREALRAMLKEQEALLARMVALVG